MIYLIEPLCRDVSHEKVNSGLISHLLAASSPRNLVVISDRTHSRVLRQNFDEAGRDVDGITWEDLGPLPPSGVFLRSVYQIRLLSRLLFRTSPEDTVLFSSFDYSLLAILAVASRVFGIRLPHILLLCHGLLDELQHGHWRRYLPTNASSLPKRGVLRKIKAALLRLVGNFDNGWRTIRVYWRYVLFPLSRCMRLGGKPVGQYLVLSKHIEQRIRSFEWAGQIRVQHIDMPFLLAQNKQEQSRFGQQLLRIAVVGNGSPNQLKRLVTELNVVVPHGGFEIQIVGMNTAGLDGLPHVRCLSPGIRMSRAAMDRAVAEADFFLYLYDKQMFPFSCSGSFFEAYSYIKPVLCLETPCIDSYWDLSEPIGIRVETIGDLALSIAEILHDPMSASTQRARFVENLRNRRVALMSASQATRYRSLLH